LGIEQKDLGSISPQDVKQLGDITNVVDLFGGSAEHLRMVHETNPDLRTASRSYNDIHRGIYTFVKLIERGLRKKLYEAIILKLETGKLTGDDDFDIAVKTYLEAPHPRGPSVQGAYAHYKNMKRLERALQGVTFYNKNAIDMIENHTFEPKTIIRIDPPWPGCSYKFEHTLDDKGWGRLLNGLLDLPDDIDFIMSLGAERKALELIAKHMPHAPLRWRVSGVYYRSIVCLSPRLARAYPDPGAHIDLKVLGF